VGEAGDGTTGLALAAALQPDVVVLDLGMPGIGIVETIGALREIAAGSAIIVHSIHDDAANRDLALEAGANAYIPKDIVLDELLDAIRRKAAPD
jgi:two-component system nitrate/nitrite response regulator NarL